MTLKDAPRIKWHQQNPPGLPGWPRVDISTPGVIKVAGKVRDGDIFDMRAYMIGKLCVACAWIAILLIFGLHNAFPKSWREFLDMAPDYPIGGLLKELCQFGTIVVMPFLLSMFLYGVSSLFVGGPIAGLLSLWLPKLVVLEFTSEGVEIVRSPVGGRRVCNIKSVPKIEFHASPASPTDPSAGVVVNFVYGIEVVRLFRVSQTYHQAANDFVACCQWAGSRAWSYDSVEVGETPTIQSNDMD